MAERPGGGFDGSDDPSEGDRTQDGGDPDTEREAADTLDDAQVGGDDRAGTDGSDARGSDAADEADASDGEGDEERRTDRGAADTDSPGRDTTEADAVGADGSESPAGEYDSFEEAGRALAEGEIDGETYGRLVGALTDDFVDQQLREAEQAVQVAERAADATDEEPDSGDDAAGRPGGPGGGDAEGTSPGGDTGDGGDSGSSGDSGDSAEAPPVEDAGGRDASPASDADPEHSPGVTDATEADTGTPADEAAGRATWESDAHRDADDRTAEGTGIDEGSVEGRAARNLEDATVGGDSGAGDAADEASAGDRKEDTDGTAAAGVASSDGERSTREDSAPESQEDSSTHDTDPGARTDDRGGRPADDPGTPREGEEGSDPADEASDPLPGEDDGGYAGYRQFEEPPAHPDNVPADEFERQVADALRDAGVEPPGQGELEDYIDTHYVKSADATRSATHAELRSDADGNLLEPPGEGSTEHSAGDDTGGRGDTGDTDGTSEGDGADGEGSAATDDPAPGEGAGDASGDDGETGGGEPSWEDADRRYSFEFQPVPDGDGLVTSSELRGGDTAIIKSQADTWSENSLDDIGEGLGRSLEESGLEVGTSASEADSESQDATGTGGDSGTGDARSAPGADSRPGPADETGDQSASGPVTGGPSGSGDGPASDAGEGTARAGPGEGSDLNPEKADTGVHLPPVDDASEGSAGVEGRTRTVREGDTLSDIAEEEYGDPEKWPVIYEANSDLVDDPDLVHPGDELTVPSQEVADEFDRSEYDEPDSAGLGEGRL